jgi:hypothetical protein
MIFFSRGSHGRGNRGRGRTPNDFWKGGNRTLQFSIQFDVDSEEFNQHLQTGFLNLAKQRAFQSPPPLEIPPFHPHPNTFDIPV